MIKRTKRRLKSTLALVGTFAAATLARIGVNSNWFKPDPTVGRAQQREVIKSEFRKSPIDYVPPVQNTEKLFEQEFPVVYIRPNSEPTLLLNQEEFDKQATEAIKRLESARLRGHSIDPRFFEHSFYTSIPSHYSRRGEQYLQLLRENVNHLQNGEILSGSEGNLKPISLDKISTANNFSRNLPESITLRLAGLLAKPAFDRGVGPSELLQQIFDGEAGELPQHVWDGVSSVMTHSITLREER